MAIARYGITGCCASAIFYNLGGAHGHPRYENIEEFADRILTLGFTDANFALTNANQAIERGFLEACGFKQVAHSNRVWTHHASQQELSKGLEPFRISKEKRYLEKLAAQKKQREEQQKARIELEKQRREIFEKKQVEFKALGIEKVTVTEVTQAIRRDNRGLQTWCRERFNFDLPNHDKRWHCDSDIARAINYRIVRNATNGAKGEDIKST